MTEKQFVSRVVFTIKAHWPDAVVFKHNDASTAGIPDVSVTLRGRTYWIECKKLNDRELLLDVVERRRQALQHHILKKLAWAGFAGYLVWRPRRIGWYLPTGHPSFESRDLKAILEKILHATD